MSTASYIVIQDRPFDLHYSMHPSERARSGDFSLPPEAIVDDLAANNERVVLHAQINPSGDADLSFAISVRKREADDWSQVFAGSFVTGVNRALMEVFRADLLTWQNNQVRFEVTSGQGSIRISSVVLWVATQRPA